MANGNEFIAKSGVDSGVNEKVYSESMHHWNPKNLWLTEDSKDQRDILNQSTMKI